MSESNPVPSEGGTLVQSPADAARILAVTGPVSVVVPGFAIESTLGRGGMGVVYKATQTGLNRAVALKMLIAGPYADPSARARFLLEAESVAALEHPHIIRVFAFGESGEHPYLAMEYVPGGTLAERIKKNGPLPAKEATELLAKLADAVAHAHSRGVVHRDIKPLNVMLTADGEPRLTDFGLAKVGRADQNLSVTGQVLGTPAYMSPEQAAGKVHEVGTAADVYALGAVLYDLLTGRPPFTGDSAAVTLQKVISEEPARLRKLNPLIPRDLETICLKCLEKNPAKRYPTAQALADDLLRYLRSEPITVRPTGALERGYKWVKRNTVVAGAGAAVALALLVGSAASLGFGLYARDQAGEARAKQKAADTAAAGEREAAARAERAKDAAVAAREELRDVNGKLVRSQERVSRTLARALLGPVVPKSRRAPLSALEADALWQIAELRGDVASRMILEEATGSPLALGRLEGRGEYILHTVLGLDATRRIEADGLLRARLNEPGTGGGGTALASGIARADCITPETARAACRVISRALTGEGDVQSRRDLIEDLAVAAGRLEPSEAAPIFLDIYTAERSADARDLIAALMIRSVERLGGAEGAAARARLADVLVDSIGRDKDTLYRELLVKKLFAVTGRMDPAAAGRVHARAADDLVGTLVKAPFSPQLFTTCLTVVDRLDPADGAKARARLARYLLDALVKAGPSITFQEQLRGALVELAARLGPAEAEEFCTEAVGVLGPALTQEKAPAARRNLAASIAALAPRMKPADAEPVCARSARALAESLVADKLPAGRRAHAVLIGRLSAYMTPDEAKKVRGETASLLTVAMLVERSAPVRRTLALGVSDLAARMTPAEAAGACAAAARVLTDALDGEKNVPTRRTLTDGLLALAEWMEPAQARVIYERIARVFTEALAEETNAGARANLADGLAAVVVRMEPAAAAKVDAELARTLLAAIGREPSAFLRCNLAVSLTTVAGRLERSEGAKVCAGAADALFEALTAERDALVRESLVTSLMRVAPRMEPAASAAAHARLAGILSESLAGTKDSFIRIGLASRLAAVAGSMEPAAGAAVCTRATRTALDALAREAGSVSRDTSASVVATLAARADPAEVIPLLLTAFARETSAPVRSDLGLALAAVVRARTGEAGTDRARIAGVLVEVSATAGINAPTVGPSPRGVVTEELGAVAAGLPWVARERPREVSALAGSFAAPHNLLPSLARLERFTPSPRPLPAQTLVDLLKHPFCVGEARRVVLDALELTYQRPFKDQWEFVEYAQKHQPQLDLLTPPKRPQQP